MNNVFLLFILETIYNIMSYTQRNLLWEAVSSYFVNDYFSYIYNTAKSTQKHETLTEAYQQKVEIYIRGIKNVEKNYKRLCCDLHRFITKAPRFKSLMYGEFVDRLVSSFTPSDYYEILNRDQKDEIFSSILNDVASSIGAFCVKPSTLRKIIDEHDKSKKITQDIIYRECLQTMAIKKESLTHSFIRSIGQVKESVPIEVVNQYIEQIQLLTNENENLKSIISDLENCNDRTVNKYEEREKGFRKLIEFLQNRHITIQQSTTKEALIQTEEQVEVPSPPLTEDNLKKHLADPKNKPQNILKDEHSDSSSSEVVGTQVRVQVKENNKDNESLDSGKKDVEDNINDLLLVDQLSNN